MSRANLWRSREFTDGLLLRVVRVQFSYFLLAFIQCTFLRAFRYVCFLVDQLHFYGSEVVFGPFFELRP